MVNPLDLLAGSTGLEPAASGVTGRRYNRLNYDPDFETFEKCLLWPNFFVRLKFQSSKYYLYFCG
jgi:hypothetical protein